MLFIAIAVGLLTGPVEATIKSFKHTGPTVGSFLCPNQTHLYECTVSGTKLQWIATDIDRNTVDIISFSPTFHTVGFVSNQSEFSFTWISNVDGVYATATSYSSVDLTSTRIECKDGDDMSSNFTRLNVKNPLDPPALTVTYSSNNVAELTWDSVGCAGLYIVEILDLDVRQMLNGTKYTTPVLQTGVTYHGRVSAFGGSTSQFTAIGVNLSTINVTTSNGADNLPNISSTSINCFNFSPVYKLLSRKSGYTLMFKELPDGGSVHLKTSDGHLGNVTVENNTASIFETTNVTVIVTYQNGTEYCSEMLPDPGSVLEYSEYVTLILFGELILAAACGGIGAALALLAVHYWNKKIEREKKGDKSDVVTFHKEQKKC